jgi:hypothetical protein
MAKNKRDTNSRLDMVREEISGLEGSLGALPHRKQ